MEPAADARAGASRFGQPVFQVASAPDAMHVLRFGAFDTRVKLSAYGEEALVRTAFRKALADFAVSRGFSPARWRAAT